MNDRGRDAIRITTAGALAAAAICIAVGTAWSLVRTRPPAHFVVLMFVFFGAITAALGVAAQRVYHRRWRDLFKIVAGFAAVMILSLASTLPRDAGLDEAVRRWVERTDLVMFPVFVPLFFLVAPFWLAYRFWRASATFADRRIPNGPRDAALPPIGVT